MKGPRETTSSSSFFELDDSALSINSSLAMVNSEYSNFVMAKSGVVGGREFYLKDVV